MTKAKKKAPARTVAKPKPKATAAKSTTKSKPKVTAVKTTAKAKPTAKKASATKPKTAVKVTTARSKVAAKAAPKTVAKRKPATKPSVKAKTPSAAKKTAAPAKKQVVRKASTTASTTKAAPTKLTDVEKLKLQIKNLRASLKETTTENELQKKQIVSLTRKNTNLMRKLDTPSAVTKPKARTNKAKPISLALPKQETKLRPKTSTRAKQKAGDSDNEKWVDKWWETF